MLKLFIEIISKAVEDYVLGYDLIKVVVAVGFALDQVAHEVEEQEDVLGVGSCCLQGA